MGGEVALVGVLIGEFAEQGHDEPAEAPHNSSA